MEVAVNLDSYDINRSPESLISKVAWYLYCRPTCTCSCRGQTQSKRKVKCSTTCVTHQPHDQKRSNFSFEI